MLNVLDLTLGFGAVDQKLSTVLHSYGREKITGGFRHLDSFVRQLTNSFQKKRMVLLLFQNGSRHHIGLYCMKMVALHLFYRIT